MGDLNAKVGDEHEKWKDVLGHHGFGKINNRGEKLLTFCAANNLCITNTMYKQKKTSRQWTWESSNQKTHNKIDYIMINNKWKNCITNSRSFPSADVGSDHQLVLADLHLRFKMKPKPNVPKRFDVFKLSNATVKQNYEIEIGGKFGPLLNDEDTDVNTLWEGVKSVFNNTSEELLGKKKPNQSKPWMTEEVLELCKF
jgi:hypothetical protein